MPKRFKYNGGGSDVMCSAMGVGVSTRIHFTFLVLLELGTVSRAWTTYIVRVSNNGKGWFTKAKSAPRDIARQPAPHPLRIRFEYQIYYKVVQKVPKCYDRFDN